MPREEFADTEKEIGKVKTSFESLITVIEALGKAGDKKLASLVPEGTVQKLNAVEKAYDDYSKAVAQVAAAE
jgi:hypothetical protein